MNAIWFTGWSESPLHKTVYQTAISFVAAVACIAALELMGVSIGAKRLSAVPVAIVASVATSYWIHSYFWKSYTPYISIEKARIMASQQALSAPTNARLCLAVALFITLECAFAILFDIWHGGPIWRLGEIPPIGWFQGIAYSVGCSFQRPFNKLLPSLAIKEKTDARFT